jgi:hypothetical protein
MMCSRGDIHFRQKPTLPAIQQRPLEPANEPILVHYNNNSPFTSLQNPHDTPHLSLSSGAQTAPS